MWNIIKEATNEQRFMPEISSLYDLENREIRHKQKIAEELNTYFSTVGKQLADQIDIHHNHDRECVTDVGAIDSFFLNPISGNGLKNKLIV